MKYAALILIIVFASCHDPKAKTNKEMAKDAVMEYFKTHLHDLDSYEEVSFEVDTAKIKYEYTADGEKEAVHVMTRVVAPDLYKISEDSAKKLEAAYKLKAAQEVYDTSKYFWRVEVTYRSKNTLGAKVLNSTTFGLNRNFWLTYKDGELAF